MSGRFEKHWLSRFASALVSASVDWEEGGLGAKASVRRMGEGWIYRVDGACAVASERGWSLTVNVIVGPFMAGAEVCVFAGGVKLLRCATCHGSGELDDSLSSYREEWIRCGECGGSGFVEEVRDGE